MLLAPFPMDQGSCHSTARGKCSAAPRLATAQPLICQVSRLGSLGNQLGPDHPGSATHTCAGEGERKRRRERAVNEGREKQAIEILDLPAANWAGRLVSPAVLSGHPVGRDPIAQLSWVGVEGQTVTL